VAKSAASDDGRALPPGGHPGPALPWGAWPTFGGEALEPVISSLLTAEDRLSAVPASQPRAHHPRTSPRGALPLRRRTRRHPYDEDTSDSPPPRPPAQAPATPRPVAPDHWPPVAAVDAGGPQPADPPVCECQFGCRDLLHHRWDSFIWRCRCPAPPPPSGRPPECVGESHCGAPPDPPPHPTPPSEPRPPLVWWDEESG